MATIYPYPLDKAELYNYDQEREKFEELDMSQNETGTENQQTPEGEEGDVTKLTDDDLKNLKLHQLARERDLNTMTQLIKFLEKGKKLSRWINSPDKENLCPLHYAAKSNHLGVVKCLVENGADVNILGVDGDTPLHYAARYIRQKKNTDTTSTEDSNNSITVEDYLISKGARPKDVNIYGQTALHFAAMRGNDVAVKSFLELKDQIDEKGESMIDIEATDKQGLTPLHAACIHNQVTIAGMMIQAGAELQCKTIEQSTPLHLACAEGHDDVVKLLFDAAGPEISKEMLKDSDTTGYTCLHHAADNGHDKIVEMCIQRKAKVNQPTLSSLYPLHLAAAAGKKNIVEMLLNNRAKVDVTSDDQATPLHKAAMYNRVDVAEVLINKRAPLNKRDADGYTPFLLAAVYGHTDMLQLLMKKCTDVTATEKNDKTALHLAAEENMYAALEVLLSNDDLKEMIRNGDRYDSEPLHIAAEKGCYEAFDLLIKKGADIDGKNEEEQTPLHLAAIHGRTKIVRKIISEDPRAVNDEDENSNTPLHLAALVGMHKTVEVLIELGADVKSRNSSQWTPLDCAASKGWVKTAKILLENDAPVEAMDKAKTTPLHLASEWGHERMVNLLLKSGANVSQRNVAGSNCLDLAIESNKKDCAIAIINSEHWKDALRNQNKDPEPESTKDGSKNGKMNKILIRDTPMRKLIRKMPDVAELVFNKCIVLPGNPLMPKDSKQIDVEDHEHAKFEVEFRYEFLDDAYSVWKEVEDPTESDTTTDYAFDIDGNLKPGITAYTTDGEAMKKNHCLHVMVASSREILLAHPLVLSLLQYKWDSYVRIVYYINFVIYAIFLTFLTGYVVVTENKFYADCSIALAALDKQNLFAKIGKFIIILMCTWNLLREFLQIYLSRLSYIGMENLIEWVVYVTSFLLVVDFNHCQRETGYREGWQWTTGAVAIFLAWVNLVLFIQKLPAFGIYVVMFTDVLKTFVQFFIVFALFIIAFGLGFFVLLRNQEPFGTVQESLIKTTVMMIGEFDYGDIFYSGVNDPHYKIITYMLFLVFMIIMSILIMNLLVGLAVDDIKAVQEKAELKRIAMQVDLALDVERLVPEFVRRKFIKKKLKMDLNAGLLTRVRKYMHIGKTELTPKYVKAALNPELSDMKRLKDSQEKLQRKMDKIQHELSSKMDSILAYLRSQGNGSEEDFEEIE